MKRLTAALAAGTLATFGAFAVASPASAEELAPHYATGAWVLQDWTGPYPDVLPSEASLSEATCDLVTLTKPDVAEDEDAIYGPSSDGDVGTDFTTVDLNLYVVAGDLLQVNYALPETGVAAAGAVRMFGYSTIDADTLNDGPNFGPAIVDEADGLTGTLTIEFTGATTIRTFGLTYDASNDTEDTITFTNLRLVHENQDVVPIAFCAKPVVEPSTEAQPTLTVTTATLPVTGASVTTLVLVGGAVVVVGVVLVAVGRRRRDQVQ